MGGNETQITDEFIASQARLNAAHRHFEREHPHFSETSGAGKYSDPAAEQAWRQWFPLHYAGNYHPIQSGDQEAQSPSQPAPGLLEACKVAVDLWDLNALVVRDKLEAAIAAEEKRLATPPDRAARLREAAPEMWPIVAAVVRSKTVHPPGCPGVVLGIELPDGILERADELWDELQPTADES